MVDFNRILWKILEILSSINQRRLSFCNSCFLANNIGLSLQCPWHVIIGLYGLWIRYCSLFLLKSFFCALSLQLLFWLSLPFKRFRNLKNPNVSYISFWKKINDLFVMNLCLVSLWNFKYSYLDNSFMKVSFEQFQMWFAECLSAIIE